MRARFWLVLIIRKPKGHQPFLGSPLLRKQRNGTQGLAVLDSLTLAPAWRVLSLPRPGQDGGMQLGAIERVFGCVLPFNTSDFACVCLFLCVLPALYSGHEGVRMEPKDLKGIEQMRKGMWGITWVTSTLHSGDHQGFEASREFHFGLG